MAEENSIQKRYYTISEVSKDLGVNASLIRFWEKEFPQIKPKKGKKGNRLFTPKDLAQLKEVYHLVKQKGFTLEGARNSLKNGGSTDSQHLEVSLKLKSIKSRLENLKSDL